MSEDSLGFDTILELCSDQHRRIALATLAADPRSLTLRDLTMTILESNHQTPVSEVSPELLTQVKLSLYHTHIPKLATAGIISYDPARELVEPTERFDQIQPTLSAILDADPDLEIPMEV